MYFFKLHLNVSKSIQIAFLIQAPELIYGYTGLSLDPQKNLLEFAVLGLPVAVDKFFDLFSKFNEHHLSYDVYNDLPLGALILKCGQALPEFTLR